VDEDKRLAMLFTKDILKNQLTRDTPKIAASFDRVALEKLETAGALLAEAIGIYTPQLIKYGLDDERLQPTCARLLNHATESLIASVHVARGGYRRQYGLIARSAVESLAVVLQLYGRPSFLADFHAGKLSGSKSVSYANKMLPLFGRLYGHLSAAFVHTGGMHAHLQRLVEYVPGEDALDYIVSNIRLNAWLIYAVSELVFFEFVGQPRYWKIIQETPEGTHFAYDPSEQERAWMEALFNDTLEPRA
jgi:hypothetical protein